MASAGRVDGSRLEMGGRLGGCGTSSVAVGCGVEHELGLTGVERRDGGVCSALAASRGRGCDG